jgi:hypothetical protein
MWRSPLPKGILGDPHLDNMIVSNVPSIRDLHRSESVNPVKLNTGSSVALDVGISRNWRVITEIQGNRDCPTSLNQTRTSTSWVIPDPYLHPVLYFQTCFVHFRLLWWDVWCVYRRYDPAEQTTQSDVIQNWSVGVTQARRGFVILRVEHMMTVCPWERTARTIVSLFDPRGGLSFSTSHNKIHDTHTSRVSDEVFHDYFCDISQSWMFN